MLLAQTWYQGSKLRLTRRRVVRLAASAVTLGSVSRVAQAQGYPERPVHVLVGYAPGGGNDIAARLIGQWLSQRLGQPFVIENRPGAGSNVATEAVVRAPADGHTLLLMSSANAVNATLYDKLNFDFIRDVAPVAALLRVPNLVAVHPSVPTQTLPDFLAYVQANPDKISMGSGPIGGPVHMTGVLFNIMAGLKMQNVPYRGEALALADLIAGQVQVVFASVPASVQYIRAGKIRALAVTTTTRAEVLPDVPIAADFVPGYESSTWYGIGAPRKTPAEIIVRLNREINAGLADRALRGRLAELGGLPIGGSPADLDQLIAEETQKWGNVIRAANIRPE
jgi:tripartite-type tricarboxylate transporter receptor subunit TctC